MSFALRILPSLRVNFSESGASSSVADRGAWSTTRPHGIGAGVGSPESGLSYVVIEQSHNPARALGRVLLMIALAALAFVVAAQG